jgi:Mrp family chromosome partitioning ATPase
MGITVRETQTRVGSSPSAGGANERLKLLRYCLARLRAWRSEYELYSSLRREVDFTLSATAREPAMLPLVVAEPAVEPTNDLVPVREDLEMFPKDTRWMSSTTGLVRMTPETAPHLAGSIDTDSILNEMTSIYPTTIPSLGSTKTPPAFQAEKVEKETYSMASHEARSSATSPVDSTVKSAELPRSVKRSFEPLPGLVSTKLAPMPTSAVKFRMPKVVGQILADGPEHWRGLAEGIAARVKEAGLRSMMVATALRGEGGTTVSVALAMSLAQHTDLRVCLVDGHFGHPGLASMLRLSARVGMEHHLRENVSLADTIVSFESSHLAVLPTLESIDLPNIVLGAEKVAEVIERLTHSFDLVMIDQGALFAGRKPMAVPSGIDAALLVRDPSKSSPELLDQLDTYVARHHVSSLGVIENGVDDV